MQVSILEPKGILWQGRIKEVVLPGEEGEMSVLDFHQPFLVKLRQGYLKLAGRRTLIKNGIASMHGDELIVLVET